MKKLSLFIAATLLLFLSIQENLNAQTPADYFAGKWNVLVKGTPSGDANLILVLEKNEDTLTGVVQDTTGNEISKIDKTGIFEDTVTFYFFAGGYDVTLDLTKKDDDNATGSLMGMFEAEGERVKDSD